MWPTMRAGTVFLGRKTHMSALGIKACLAVYCQLVNVAGGHFPVRISKRHKQPAKSAVEQVNQTPNKPLKGKARSGFCS